MPNTSGDNVGGTGEGSNNGENENNDNWLSKIFNSIGNIGNSILEGLAIPFQKLQEGIDNIDNFFSELIGYINPFNENFILKDVLDFFANIIDYLNPFSEDFFAYKLLELLGDLLKFLFVPEKSPLEDFQTKVQDKFYFVQQISTMFSVLLGNIDYGTTTPSFSITYYGQTLNIIDFSLFINYRSWLHGIILAVAWFIYIRKLFNKLPVIIGGV